MWQWNKSYACTAPITPKRWTGANDEIKITYGGFVHTTVLEETNISIIMYIFIKLHGTACITVKYVFILGLNIFYFITHWKWIEQGNNATTLFPTYNTHARTHTHTHTHTHSLTDYHLHNPPPELPKTKITHWVFLFLRYTIWVTNTITEPYYNSLLVSRIYNSTLSIMVLLNPRCQNISYLHYPAFYSVQWYTEDNETSNDCYLHIYMSMSTLGCR